MNNLVFFTKRDGEGYKCNYCGKDTLNVDQHASCCIPLLLHKLELSKKIQHDLNCGIDEIGDMCNKLRDALYKIATMGLQYENCGIFYEIAASALCYAPKDKGKED